MRFFIGVTLIVVSSIAFALDKGQFTNISVSDFEYVLKAFKSVTVYYPMPNGTGNVITQLKSRDPKVLFKSEYIINLYYSPNEDARFGGMLAKGHIGGVRLVNVLKDQFKQRNLQNTEKNPLFVVRQHINPTAEIYEYLGRKDGSPYIINGKGEKVILAGATQKLSLQLQEKIEEKITNKNHAKEIHRIGLDEKSFIRFIIEQGRKGVTVKVFGYGYKK